MTLPSEAQGLQTELLRNCIAKGIVSGNPDPTATASNVVVSIRVSYSVTNRALITIFKNLEPQPVSKAQPELTM
jgi:hypothetical protein